VTNDQADARDEIVNAARGCVDQIRSRITLDSDRLEKAVRTPEDIGAQEQFGPAGALHVKSGSPWKGDEAT